MSLSESDLIEMGYVERKEHNASIVVDRDRRPYSEPGTTVVPGNWHVKIDIGDWSLDIGWDQGKHNELSVDVNWKYKWLTIVTPHGVLWTR